ncbi:MAG: zinc ribbon domain-containing protein [Candidatus Methanospirareceae archaeon]
MQIKKTLKIPIHYGTTKEKLYKLNKLTARITYAICLISELITEDTKLDRKTLRALVRNSDIVERTRLSAGFIDQCIDKVLWSWKAYRKQHRKWERQVASAKKRDNQKWLAKLMKREPQKPSFENRKVPCRIDYRTGRIEWNRKSKLTKLWVHISTLKKNQPMDIPLNPSHYHLMQLEDAEINDFEIVKKGKKYYAHISITKECEDGKVKNAGGIDLGLNQPVAIVLLNGSMPYEDFIGSEEKEKLLEKYDRIVSELQRAKRWRKLRKIRHKRRKIAVNYDWEIANEVAKISEGYLIGIGSNDFRRGQYKGNGMKRLRKRIGKWSYGRQRSAIELKRKERGYQTVEIDEYGTSSTCHRCGSKLLRREWLPEGNSYIICWNCGLKQEADINSGYNIAYKVFDAVDEGLKVQMNWMENPASAQGGCLSIN